MEESRGRELRRQRGPWPPTFITSPQELDFAIQISPIKPLWPSDLSAFLHPWRKAYPPSLQISCLNHLVSCVLQPPHQTSLTHYPKVQFPICIVRINKHQKARFEIRSVLIHPRLLLMLKLRSLMVFEALFMYSLPAGAMVLLFLEGSLMILPDSESKMAT